MIDAKQAVQIAKKECKDVFGRPALRVEEIERTSERKTDVWSVTLSLLRPDDQRVNLARLLNPTLEYKRFLIKVSNGELVAVRIREASPLLTSL